MFNYFFLLNSTSVIFHITICYNCELCSNTFNALHDLLIYFNIMIK